MQRMFSKMEETVISLPRLSLTHWYLLSSLPSISLDSQHLLMGKMLQAIQICRISTQTRFPFFFHVFLPAIISRSFLTNFSLCYLLCVFPQRLQEYDWQKLESKRLHVSPIPFVGTPENDLLFSFIFLGNLFLVFL